MGLLATGCFDVGDIDRTQPNKVDKSVFTDGGEWFFRQTVIDMPATSGVSFIGEQGQTHRVVWEIEENFLFAYRSYPFMDGADGHVRPGTGPYRDNPIAAFAIQAHFDVNRQYNAATGEQTNVIVENVLDRPWYDREFMRVDWSQNLIADFQFSASAVQQQPVGFYQGEDPRETKDRVVITEDYIDLVHTITAQPELNQLYTRHFGFPILECWLYTNIHQDCLGAQIKIRSSFMRAPDSSDYLAVNFDDNRFAKFGYFRAERWGYNAEYGVIEPAAQRLLNRFSVWKDAASCYDPEAEHPYSACSPSQIKPIVYYLNEDFPAEYKPFAMENAREWNRIFRDGVLAGTGWTEAALGTVPLFTICQNNPVKAGDPKECGEAGLSPQIGDLRYSMYYYVPNVLEWSPLGYGPSAQDPLTGETIQGNAFFYGAPGKWLAARTRDILQLEMGILDLEDIADGIPAQQAVNNVRGRMQSRFANINQNFDKQRIEDLVGSLRIDEKATRLNHQIQTGEAFMDLRPGRLQRLQSSSVDEMLMTPDLKDMLRGFGQGQERADGALDFQGMHDMSKLLSPDLFRLGRYREQRLLNPQAGGCILTAQEFFDVGLGGLGDLVKREFYDLNQDPPVLKAGKSEAELFDFLVGRTMSDTQLHEIGHTVGLRHNFSGSTDALNFGPDYWRLRGPGYTMSQNDVRPRPLWGLSGAFLDGYDQALAEGLFDHQDSSVMDYSGTYGTNTKLGYYDRAAIKYAYFDAVEVFNAPDLTADRAQLLRAGELHYTYYPEVVSNASTYEDRVAAMYDRRDVNYRFTRKGGDLFDDSLIEVPYSFCSDEYRDASSTCALWDTGMDNYERTWKKAVDYRNYHVLNAFKRERVGFGVDVFGYLNRVYTRDFTYMLNQYKNWVNDELIIRRDRPCVWYENGQRQEAESRFTADACGLPGFLGAIEALNLFAEVIQTPDLGCYTRMLPGCYLTAPTNEFGIEGEVALVNADPDFCDTLQPTGDRVPLKVDDRSAYHHVRNTVTCEGVAPITDPLTSARISEPLIEVEYGVGRPSITTYDRERYGYYFYWKPVVMGSWWDKWLAVKAVGDPYTDFIGVDASSDTRSYLISFNTLFGDDINNLVGGIVTEAPDVYGPSINLNKDGVEFVDILSLYVGGGRDAVTAAWVDPDQQYTFRLLAMFNAAFQNQITDDLDFSQSLAVHRRFANTAVEIPQEILDDPSRYMEFRDPESGYLYYTVRQNRENSGQPIYSIAYEYIRTIKDRFYVGGAEGPGTVLKEGFLSWQVQSEIRILEIMRETHTVFGRAGVWEGDF
jgi:hypothetical protein